MIDAERIELAEKRLNMAGQITGTLVAVFETAGVEPTSLEKLVAHHRESLRKRVPNMDPRIEPVWNMMMAHFFMVGVLCGRQEAEG